MSNVDKVSLLIHRAGAAIRESRHGEARHLLKAAVRHDPSNDQALLWLVYLEEDGRASLSYLAQLLEAHPHHPEAREAIRWARRRTPTSRPRDVNRRACETSSVSRRPRGLTHGIVLVTVLIGLALRWGLTRSPASSVRAEAGVAAVSQEPLSSTLPPLMEIVKVAIPLFTSTPTLRSTDHLSSTPTPSSAWVPLIGHAQSKNLSCESRSAADLARYWGKEVEELEFLTALGRSDNPHVGFVGDAEMPPGSLPPHGYGVYVEPVAVTLRDYDLDARPVYNLGLDGLRSELIAGRPVMVWATYGMQVYEPREWTSSDGRVSTVVPFMHTFIVTGFDEQGLTVLDAYDATTQRYPFETFAQVWALFDQMALVVTGPLP